MDRRAGQGGRVVADMLARAIAAHLAGQLPVAAGLYQDILRLDRKQADALHLLGMLLCQIGQFADAEGLLREAVRVQPKAADFHANLAYALQSQGKSDEAVAAARNALRLKRPFPEASNSLGNALSALGRYDEAEAAWRDAIRANPRYAEALANLGGLLRRLNRAGEAEPLLIQALTLDGTRHEALLALALTNLDLDRVDQGMAMLAQAVALRPDHGVSRLSLAAACQRIGRQDEALVHYRIHACLEPGDAEGWNGYGLQLQGTQPVAAATAFQRAAILDLKMVEALSNGADLLRLAGQPARAEAMLRQALAIRPDYAAAHGNLGLLLKDRGDLAGAEAAFDLALAHDGDHEIARFNRSLIHLATGRLASGWADYGNRHRAAGGVGRAGDYGRLPDWRGESLSGQRLLGWMEQGIGDVLMFGSLLPALHRRALAEGGTLVIECDQRLIPAFTRSLPGVTCVALGAAVATGASLRIAAGSLPGLLGGDLGIFAPPPDEAPGWLRPDADLAARWRARLAALGPGLRVGIAWTSRRMVGLRSASYLPLADWGALLSQPDLVLVNLQYDLANPDRHAEIRKAEQQFGRRLHRWPDVDLFHDLDDVLALTSELDLVIGVANAAIEIAGAVGVPCWRLGLRDWTMLGTGGRPWFPSQRQIMPRPGCGLDDALAMAVRSLRQLFSGASGDGAGGGAGR